MLRSMLTRTRMLPMLWWDRVIELWYCGDRTVPLLWTVPLAFVAVLGTLATFSYTEHMEARAATQRRDELRCLAENIYYEGRGEPLAGQFAVAEVTMNRVASSRFPDSVCEVVHQKSLDVRRGRYVGAFSWTELDLPSPAGPAWTRAMEVAIAVYDGQHAPVLPEALHYHAVSITPSWAKSKPVLARIGHHIFYP